MGVPKFFRWFASRTEFRRHVFLPKINSSLSIDINSELHKAASESYGYSPDFTTEQRTTKIEENNKKTLLELDDQFIDRFIQNLNRVVQEVNPRDTLFIAVDGVPPYAKMIQQRSRRFMVPWSKNPNIVFDSNSLTPGTHIMSKIDIRIKKWINETGNLPHVVIYSGSDMPGEGEHKIMDAFREGKYYTSDGNHIILGMDTDLFMLTLILPQDNIYLWRPNPHLQESLQLISIYAARRQIANMLGNRDIIASSSDFVLMTSLLGNDFIPRHPSLEDYVYSIDKLIEIYRRKTPSGEFVDLKTSNIKWNIFKIFINGLALSEPDFLLHNLSDFTYPVPFIVLKDALSNNILSYKKFKAEWYTHVKYNENIMLNPNINYKQPIDTMISDMTVSYMDTLQFIQQYYRKGTHSINLNFSYKFHYTPLLADLYSNISKHHELVMKGKAWLDNTSEFLGISQLQISILPIQSKEYLDNTMRFQLEQLITKYDEWYNHWPLQKPTVDYQGHGQLHTGIILIPFPPIKYVKQLRLSFNRVSFVAPKTIIAHPLKKTPIYRKTPKETPVQKGTENVIISDDTEVNINTIIADELPDISGLVDVVLFSENETYNPAEEEFENKYIDPSYL